ncbi:MAG: hypothetical protein LC725_07310 [Lentisphaerae bacterium]|nr:hypothetical protein [Lentisphaerota bacterium]
MLDRRAGKLAAVSRAGQPLITAGPEFNLWRAPLDNDGVKCRPQHRQIPGRPWGRWVLAGYDRMRRRVDRVELKSVGRDYLLRSDIFHACRPGGGFDVRHIYRFTAAGLIFCEHVFKFAPGMADVPRLGVMLTVAAGLERLDWFGRGPWESYADRKYAAEFGHYHGTVSGQYFPYIMPQENGNKEDVTWFSLRGRRGVGLQIQAGKSKFGFSAHHFTPVDLTALTHACEVRSRPETTVLIDARQRGLGTASCGPDTLDSYKIFPGQYRLKYVIVPLGGRAPQRWRFA